MPECLFCGDLGNGVSIFVQNTTKTSQSKVVHEWGILHDKFLLRLKEATIQEIAFEKSDFCRVLTTLQKHTDWLPEEVDKAMVMNAVEDTVKHWEGKRVGFCAYHADFTPWNMYVEQDELFVFDWEYAQMTYPPCWINIISSSRHSFSSVTGQPRTSWLMLIRRMGNGWTRNCSNAICWT